MSELKNCMSCGRDCTSESGYCYRCIGRGQQGVDERKDRHIVRFDGDPIMNINGDFVNSYGEDSMLDCKHVGFVSAKEEDRRYKRHRRIYTDL